MIKPVIKPVKIKSVKDYIGYSEKGKFSKLNGKHPLLY